MRKLAAAVLALPTLGVVYLSAWLGRSVLSRLVVLLVALVLVASGVVVGLPQRQVQAVGPTTFAPLAPAGVERSVPTDQPLKSGVEIAFNKPMDAASVAAALVVTPATPVELSWDASGEVLTLRPRANWAPGTFYTVDIAGSALDHDGLGLGQPVHTGFVTARLTAGTISATQTVAGLAGPGTSFRVTFDRAVKLSAAARAFTISPPVSFSVSGDDPTDQDSHVFTLTPTSQLAADETYTVSFLDGQPDAEGLPLARVAPLTVTTLVGPAVVRFRPLDRASQVDPRQAISVRFTMAMDTAATEGALTVFANDALVTGKTSWAEGDTVLVFKPAQSLPPAAKVVATVSAAARSATAIPLAASATTSFTVAPPAPAPTTKPTAAATKKPTATPRPTTKPIAAPGGGTAVGSAPWYSQETYYLRLMNCTRTGGWVTSSGGCASSGPHTLPAARALALDKGISDRVARPFAKYMADRNILNHFADGTPGTRLARAGYTSYHWAENIGAQSDLRTHLYFQSEAPCRCDHYKNMMNPDYDRAGIGVWITSGHWRLVVDFYRP